MTTDTTNQSLPRSRNAAIDAAFDLGTALICGLQGLVELNAQAVKASLAEQRALTDATLSAHSVAEMIDLQAHRLPVAVKKSLAYWRNAKDVVVQTQTGLFMTMHEQIEHRLQTFARTVALGCGAVLAPAPHASASLIVAGPPPRQASGWITLANGSGEIVYPAIVQRYRH